MCCYCLLKGIGSRRACSSSAFPLDEVEDDCGPPAQEGERCELKVVRTEMIEAIVYNSVRSRDNLLSRLQSVDGSRWNVDVAV
jgi:hypothetical protein